MGKQGVFYAWGKPLRIALLVLILGCGVEYAAQGMGQTLDALLSGGPFTFIGWPRAAALGGATAAAFAAAYVLANTVPDLLFVNRTIPSRTLDADVLILTVSTLAGGKQAEEEEAARNALDRVGDATMTLTQAAEDAFWAHDRFAWQQTFRTVAQALRDRDAGSGGITADKPLGIHLIPTPETSATAAKLAEMIQGLVRNTYPVDSHPDLPIEAGCRPSLAAVTIVTCEPPEPRDGHADSYDSVRDAIIRLVEQERDLARKSDRPPPRIVIDITSGRKTWSAVAAICALERNVRFSYVRDAIYVDPSDPARGVQTPHRIEVFDIRPVLRVTPD